MSQSTHLYVISEATFPACLLTDEKYPEKYKCIPKTKNNTKTEHARKQLT